MTNLFTPSIRFDNMKDHTSTILSDFKTELRADTLDQVRNILAQAEQAAQSGLWVAGFVSYECAPAFDKCLEVHDRDATWCSQLPFSWFGIFEKRTTTPLRLRREVRMTTTPWVAQMSNNCYMSSVRSILEEIRAGNVYQVNFTNPVVNVALADLRSLYRQLLVTQLPAYGALIELDDVAIVSASPELFFEWDGVRLRSRPMKGTVARGRWPDEDSALSRELANSPKERAENVMIVDLIRNDMGRVARVGSVTTRELLTLEPYPSVWQLVSEVGCETRPDIGLVDIFDAMFPCGSVTGAPKL